MGRTDLTRPGDFHAADGQYREKSQNLEPSFPHSAARIAMIRTASGPPAPPSSLAAPPTATREKRTTLPISSAAICAALSLTGGVGADGHQIFNAGLLSQRLDDGADQQRAEQSLGHSAPTRDL